MVGKKVIAEKSTKKAATKAVPAHPSWLDMIKECIASNPEDARSGVSRPQIKKFVEETYKLQIGNAQNTQLSKAIASGAEKGALVLPKGPSGRVKLPPKNSRADASASKENKPTKPAAKAVVKPKIVKTASARATPAKKPTTKPRAKATATKAAPAKKAIPSKAALKAVAAKIAATKTKAATTPKKTLAGKKTAPAKKTTAASKRGAAKKVVTGSTSSARAKVAAKKTPVRKAAAKPTVSTPNKRRAAKKA